jgi:molybdenum cofactor biosynthesis enzyme
MKKITSVIVLLVLISTSVFAFPVTNESKILQNEESDLFATVQATALTGQEMEAVEGAGVFGLITGAIVGIFVVTT